MTRSALSFTALILLAAVPALAQQAPPRGSTVSEAQLSGVRNTLAVAQQRLQQQGYDVQPTGHYDAATRNAVTAFQADHGIEPTGDVTLTTLAALGVGVEPAGASTAMVAPEPGDQAAMATDNAAGTCPAGQ